MSKNHGECQKPKNRISAEMTGKIFEIFPASPVLWTKKIDPYFFPSLSHSDTFSNRVFDSDSESGHHLLKFLIAAEPWTGMW